jgi:hypothetical protein
MNQVVLSRRPEWQIIKNLHAATNQRQGGVKANQWPLETSDELNIVVISKRREPRIIKDLTRCTNHQELTNCTIPKQPNDHEKGVRQWIKLFYWSTRSGKSSRTYTLQRTKDKEA